MQLVADVEGELEVVVGERVDDLLHQLTDSGSEVELVGVRGGANKKIEQQLADGTRGSGQCYAECARLSHRGDHELLLPCGGNRETPGPRVPRKELLAAKLGQRFVACGVRPQRALEACDLKQALNLVAEAAEGEAACFVPVEVGVEPLPGPDDQPDPGRVDEFAVREIDKQSLFDAFEAFLELLCRVEVELSGHGEDRDAVAFFLDNLETIRVQKSPEGSAENATLFLGVLCHINAGV